MSRTIAIKLLVVAAVLPTAMLSMLPGVAFCDDATSNPTVEEQLIADVWPGFYFPPPRNSFG